MYVLRKIKKKSYIKIYIYKYLIKETEYFCEQNKSRVKHWCRHRPPLHHITHDHPLHSQILQIN